jgi:hypothetical protein
MSGKRSGGKGSRYRHVDWKKWDEGYELAFGKKNKKLKQENNDDDTADGQQDTKTISDSSGTV